MSYDPDDHRSTWARVAGPLVLWAAVILVLVSMGHRGPTPSGAPAFLAESRRPSEPGGRALRPDPGGVHAGEAHSS